MRSSTQLLTRAHSQASTRSVPLTAQRPSLVFEPANGYMECYSTESETAVTYTSSPGPASNCGSDIEGSGEGGAVSIAISHTTTSVSVSSKNGGSNCAALDHTADELTRLTLDPITPNRTSVSSMPSMRHGQRPSAETLNPPRSPSSLASIVDLAESALPTPIPPTETETESPAELPTDAGLAEDVAAEAAEKADPLPAPLRSSTTWPVGKESTTSHRRIIAIGDLHGDLQAAKDVLEMAGLVDKRGRWIGGKACMVQLGDVADRGPDTLALFRYLHRLRKEAAAAGGEVVLIMGNHELMTLMHKKHRLHLPFLRDPFSEHGEVGKWLKHLPIMAVIDGNVFAHGGVSPYWAKLGCERTNRQAQRSLKSYMHSGDLLAAKVQFPVFGDNGPAWYRRYAYDKDEASVHMKLDEALASLNARRMIVAHSPTRSPKMHVRCDGKFIDIDTKISRFFKWPDGTPDGGHFSALEIIGDRVTAIYPSGRELISDGNRYCLRPSQTMPTYL